MRDRRCSICLFQHTDIASDTQLLLLSRLLGKRNLKLGDCLVREQDCSLRLHSCRRNNRLTDLRPSVPFPSHSTSANHKLVAKSIGKQVHADWTMRTTSLTFWAIVHIRHRIISFHHHGGVERANQITEVGLNNTIELTAYASSMLNTHTRQHSTQSPQLPTPRSHTTAPTGC